MLWKHREHLYILRLFWPLGNKGILSTRPFLLLEKLIFHIPSNADPKVNLCKCPSLNLTTLHTMVFLATDFQDYNSKIR